MPVKGKTVRKTTTKKRTTTKRDSSRRAPTQRGGSCKAPTQRGGQETMGATGMPLRYFEGGKKKTTRRKTTEKVKLHGKKTFTIHKGALHKHLKVPKTYKFRKSSIDRMAKIPINTHFTFRTNRFKMTAKLKKEVSLAKAFITMRKNKRGGGSSDWRSTVYSRGSSIAPNMPPDQFRQFSKTGQYIPNSQLACAAAPISSGCVSNDHGPPYDSPQGII
jgi:hypothetical protein